MAGPSHTTSCFLALLPPLARLGIRIAALPAPPPTVLGPLGVRAGSAEGGRGQEGPHSVCLGYSCGTHSLEGQC